MEEEAKKKRKSSATSSYSIDSKISTPTSKNYGTEANPDDGLKKKRVEIITSCSDMSKKTRQRLLQIQEHERKEGLATKINNQDSSGSGSFNINKESDNLSTKNRNISKRVSVYQKKTSFNISAILLLFMFLFLIIATLYFLYYMKKFKVTLKNDFPITNTASPKTQSNKTHNLSHTEIDGRNNLSTTDETTSLAAKITCLDNAKNKKLIWQSRWQGDLQDQNVPFEVVSVNNITNPSTIEIHLELRARAPAKKPYRTLVVYNKELAQDLCSNLHKELPNSPPPTAVLP